MTTPSLAQLFFGRLANFFRARRAARKGGTYRPRFEPLEARLMLSADILGTTLQFDALDNGAADDYTLRYNAGNGDLEILSGEEVVASQALSQTSDVVINGEDEQDDHLTLDFGFGGFFTLAGGIAYNGGTGGIDKMTDIGGQLETVTHTATETGPGLSGSIAYDDGSQPPLVVSYTDLEPLTFGSNGSGGVLFNLTAGDDQAVLENAAFGGLWLRSLNGTFETTNFAFNAFPSITINPGNGVDTISIGNISNYTGTVNIVTAGTSGTDNVTFFNTGGSLTTLGNLFVQVSGSITDSPGTRLTVTGSTRLEGDSINLGDAGVSAEQLNFNTLSFASAGNVSIVEQGDMVLGQGTSLAGSLSLSTPQGAIGNATGAVLDVTGNATFNGVNGVSLSEANAAAISVGGIARFIGPTVTIGAAGGTQFGSVAFSGGNVTIREQGDMQVTGFANVDTLTLISSGTLSDATTTSITTAGAASFTAASIALADRIEIWTVNGHASFSANGTGSGAISVGQGGRVMFGSLAFNTAGDVAIFEDSLAGGAAGTRLLGDSNAGNLTLTSRAISGLATIADAPGATLSVHGDATFSAVGGSISLADSSSDSLTVWRTATFIGNAVTVWSPGTVDLGSVAFTGASVSITSDEGLFLASGKSTAQSLTLISSSWIFDNPRTDLVVSGNATLQGAFISLATYELSTLRVTGTASLTATQVDGAIYINPQGQAAFGSLTINTGGAAVITNVDFNFTGTSSVGSLTLTAVRITDAPNANLTVTGTATLNASVITLGDGNNTTNFGSLRFNSGGVVAITEDSDSNLTGNSSVESLSLTSSGAITDDASANLTVTGLAGFSGTSITLGDSATNTMNVALLGFASAGAVRISVDSNTTLWTATAGSLTLNAAGAIQDAGGTVLSVTLAAALAGTSITLGDSAADITNFGSLTFNSQGAVSITEDSDSMLTGRNTASAMTLASSGVLTVEGSLDAGKGVISLAGGSSVSFGPLAALNVDIGGAGVGDFTRVAISGAVFLDGGLDVDLVDGFAPATGDRFRFMTFGSGSGFFHPFLSSLPPGLTIDYSDAADLELAFSAVPEISVSDVTVTEGDELTTDALFTVTLSHAYTQEVYVEFRTAEFGTASWSSDYLPVAGALRFAPGETSMQVNVMVIGDLYDEADESFHLVLSNAFNATIADGAAVGTILNDDPPPSVSVGDVSLRENVGGSWEVVFDVTLSKPSFNHVFFDFSTADLTALAGSDYVFTSGTTFISAGQTFERIAVPVLGDRQFEPDEQFLLRVSNVINAVLADGEAVATIQNDDFEPTITVGNISVVEGDAGTTQAVFTVSLYNPSYLPVTVDFATADVTALAGSDYQAVTGTLTFAPGETSKQVAVTVNGNVVDDDDKTFTLTLSNATNSWILQDTATAQIQDDDTAMLSIGDATVIESDDGTTTDAVFNVTLSTPSAHPVRAYFLPEHGTARADDYYLSISHPPLIFAPGETSKQLTVQVVGDRIYEGDETFLLNIFGADWAGIADGQGLATIADDDPLPVVSLTAGAGLEGDPNGVPFTLTLSNPSAFPIEFRFQAADGTAIAGFDYHNGLGLLVWPAMQTTYTYGWGTIDDTRDEFDETLQLVLTDVIGGTIGQGGATATIIDNDEGPGVFVQPYGVVEGNTGTTQAWFLLYLYEASDKAISIDFATLDGTARAGSDYLPTSGTVTFAPGEINQWVSVDIIGDIRDEAEEVFTLQISNAVDATILQPFTSNFILDDDDNNPPDAGDDAYSVRANQVLTITAPGLLANDTDVDGNPLTIAFLTAPQHGSIVAFADGRFTYTPNAGFVGTDTFTYAATDGVANDVGTVTISVLNETPDAVNDAYTVRANQVLTITAPGLLANDTDGDQDTLTVAFLTAPQHGSIVAFADGRFTYTPNAGFVGTDAFTYAVTDGVANDVATVTISVENETPDAVNDAYSVRANQVLTITAPGLLANDTDGDQDALTVAFLTAPQHGSIVAFADGRFTYTPNDGFVGTDTFTYAATDGVANDVATVTISVENETPDAVSDVYAVRANQVLTITAPGLLANDTDGDQDALTVAFLTAPQHGSIVAFADGRFTYTPNVGFVGTDAFTYAVTDGVANDVATVTISVENETPDAVNDVYAVRANQVLTITAPGLLANDTDGDQDALTVAFLTAPQHGSIVAFADGRFTYTPNDGFVGTDTFTYAATDGVANDVGTVTISVRNEAPDAVNDAYSVRANQVLTITAPGLLANDTDGDHDTLTVAFLTAAQHGSVVAFADGRFTYTPNAGFTGTDTFTYAVTDGVANDVAAVTISVVNDAPVAVNDAYQVDEDTVLQVAATGGVLRNDSDPNGDALVASLVQGPQHGTLAFNPDGSFRYTPNANFNGSDSFTYRAGDGTTTTAAVVSLTVRSVNDAPVAAGDAYSLNEDTVLTVPAGGVLANDTDVEGGALTATLVSGPAHGTLTFNANGSFTYRPNADYNGPDSFTYRASDGTGSSTVATVSLTVNPVADDGPDLVAKVKWNPDDPLRPGDKETVKVTVSNIGNAATSGAVKVKLYASKDGVLDGSDILLDTGETEGKLKAGKSEVVDFKIELPKLPSGHYVLLAVVDPGNKVRESNESNNVALGADFDFRRGHDGHGHGHGHGHDHHHGHGHHHDHCVIDWADRWSSSWNGKAAANFHDFLVKGLKRK